MGRVEQDGRAATLSPGDLAFYDSTRPYTLHFDNPFHQLVVQIPKRDLMLRDTRQLTARALGQGTAGGVVATFFTSLFGVAKGSREQSGVLFPHAVGLLSAAASFAGRVEPGPDAAEALARERVLAFLRRNLADPRLDAETVAKACHASRRTLYRMFGDEGVAARLRRMRIERAQVMLLHEPARPVASVGWLSDRHASGDAGFFLESVRPSTARFETLFSNPPWVPPPGCVFTTRSPSPQRMISTSSTSAATPAPACCGSSRLPWPGGGQAKVIFSDRNSRGDMP